MPDKYADLHLHTVFSDGTYTPHQLIEEAAKASLSAIAVVDHDTFDGIAPVQEAARSRDIEVVPGIELTAEYDASEIHILGYFIDYNDDTFIKKLQLIKQDRIERIYKILDKLRELGIDLRSDSVFNISGPGTIGRLHIARAMVTEGIVGSIPEAFSRYIGDKSPAYYSGFKLSPQEAILLIKNSGGVAVLAHPYIINNEQVIAKIIEYGIMGIEAYYPEHAAKATKQYVELARSRGLLVTGGSDCHGLAKPQARIGAVKVPYAVVEELKRARRIGV